MTDTSTIKSAIEALLFASERPLTTEQMKSVLSIDAATARKAVEELANEYEQNNRGVRIAEIAGGYQMITAVTFAPFLKKLFKARHSDRLSKPALESLAIIAYKQPLTKGEIQSLRNVNIDGVMKSLLEKNLIRITGRKKAPGRPFVYGTTRLFLEHFGLNSLEELPRIENFQALAAKTDAGEIESISEEEAKELAVAPEKERQAENGSGSPA
jgi:segregation and condensation protein B